MFEVGKRHPFDSLRGWFQALYVTLLGSSQGPRMGSFIALYGIDNSRKLIAGAGPSLTASPDARFRPIADISHPNRLNGDPGFPGFVGSAGHPIGLVGNLRRNASSEVA